MKIVFLASVEFGGGAERVVTLIANGLFDRKHEVEFITYDECESGYNLNSKIKITRVIPEKEKSLFRGFRYRKRLRSAIKEINPDVVIAFSAMGGILSIWSLLLTSIPVIVSDRTLPNKSVTGIVGNTLRLLLYPFAKGFVFQTKEISKFHPFWVDRKATIIRNPISASLPIRYDGEKRKEIITSGRMIEAKNQILLIEAFEKVLVKYPDYILKICGDGPLRGQLEKRAKDLKIEKSVCFVGMVDNVFEQLNFAEIFAFTSNFEGLPNALLEAMGLGLPCISTDCDGGGAKAILENNKSGILIPKNDVLALSNAINYLIENKEFAKKIADEAIKVRDTYSCEAIVDKWEVCIKNVVGKGKRC